MKANFTQSFLGTSGISTFLLLMGLLSSPVREALHVKTNISTAESEAFFIGNNDGSTICDAREIEFRSCRSANTIDVDILPTFDITDLAGLAPNITDLSGCTHPTSYQVAWTTFTLVNGAVTAAEVGTEGLFRTQWRVEAMANQQIGWVLFRSDSDVNSCPGNLTFVACGEEFQGGGFDDFPDDTDVTTTYYLAFYALTDLRMDLNDPNDDEVIEDLNVKVKHCELTVEEDCTADAGDLMATEFFLCEDDDVTDLMLVVDNGDSGGEFYITDVNDNIIDANGANAGVTLATTNDVMTFLRAADAGKYYVHYLVVDETEALSTCSSETTFADLITCLVEENACFDYSTECFTIKEAPDAATEDDKYICNGDAVALDVSNPNSISGATFNWTAEYNGATGSVGGANGVAFGTDAINETLTNNTDASIDVVYTITPVGPATTFCEGTPITVTVSVAPTPVLTASPMSQTVCANDIVNEAGDDLSTMDVQFTLEAMPNITLKTGEQLRYRIRNLGLGMMPTMIDNPNGGITVTATPVADADGYTIILNPADDQEVVVTDDLTITGDLSNFTQPVTIQYAIFPRFRHEDGTYCDGEDIVVTVTITPPILIDAGEPQTICSTKKLELADLNASITQGGQPFGGTWSTKEQDSDGQFLDANMQPLADADFNDAVFFMAGSADAARGFVTLVLTSDALPPACDPVEAEVIITVLKVDCGSFPWRGDE